MTASTQTAPESRRWIALLVCCSALFMTLLDVSVTNVALPSIGRAISAGPAELQWVVSGYTLAFGLVPVLAGRLGDDHGRRRMFQIGVGSFAATSLLAGIAPVTGMLIAARVLQGLAGGLINPQVSGLVQQMFRGAERGKAFGVLGTVVGVGTATGPLVGGVLIGLGGPHWGWRLVFFVNIPIGIAVIFVARRLLPPDRTSARHRLDIAGAALLGAALLCVLFAAVEYDSLHDARLALLAIPAVAFLLVFLRRERRLTAQRQDPLIDLTLFRKRSYTSGVLLAITYFPATAGLPLVLSIYYQDGFGYSALQSGLGVTSFALGSVVAAPLAGRVVTRIGRPLLLFGMAGVVVGAVTIAVLAGVADGPNVALLLAPGLFVMGAGSGAIITPNQALTLMDVDPVGGSTAGGVLQTAQRIGLAIGQAAIGAVFFAGIRHGGGVHDHDYDHGLRLAVAAALVFVVVAAAIGVVDLVRTRRSAAAT